MRVGRLIDKPARQWQRSAGGGAGTEGLGCGGGLSGETGGGERAGARYAQGGRSSMAEDESDQESERLGEELEAIGGPRLPPGLSPALSSQYYCYRFCQVSAWPRPLSLDTSRVGSGGGRGPAGEASGVAGRAGRGAAGEAEAAEVPLGPPGSFIPRCLLGWGGGFR